MLKVLDCWGLIFEAVGVYHGGRGGAKGIFAGASEKTRRLLEKALSMALLREAAGQYALDPREGRRCLKWLTGRYWKKYAWNENEIIRQAWQSVEKCRKSTNDYWENSLKKLRVYGNL